VARCRLPPAAGGAEIDGVASAASWPRDGFLRGERVGGGAPKKMRREAPQERCCPTEYLGKPLEHCRCRPRSSSSGIGCSFRVSGPRWYRRIGWSIPLCRWPLCPTVWFSRPRAAPVRDHRTGAILSSSFAFLSSFPWPTLSRAAAAAQPLSWASVTLQHMPDTEVHLPRRVPPDATFRPQGLATLSTVFSLGALVGFVSRRQRSWVSPFEA
jgi:hypothetical protein